MLRNYLYTMRKIMLLLFVLLAAELKAQNQFDTLKVMSYNIMYYGAQTSFCTNSNNNINNKDVFLKSITKYALPDILLVNEMGASVVYADRIIENVLNTDGENRYKRAGIQNNGFSDLVNGIFYDRKKLAEAGHVKVTKTLLNTDIVRAIDIISFYYRDPNLVAGADTVFIHLVGMHLKAGDTSADEDQRDLATEALMARLADDFQPGYFIAAGDLNIKSSSEASYQNLISVSNGSFRFMDPINEPGNWSNNAIFSAIHTQSTHTSGSCFSGGGLDDRFDFVLLSGQIMEDTGAVSFIEGSYRTIGNDGNHFNQSLMAGTNTSVPSTVRSALYELSDHLPVMASLKVRKLPEPLDTDTIPNVVGNLIKAGNWQYAQTHEAVKFSEMPIGSTFVLVDLYGQVVLKHEIEEASWTIPYESLPAGVYVGYLLEQKTKAKRIYIPR
jgi:endonuclease/exonuclease/phosphatase family metal-dependent hydrolase